MLAGGLVDGPFDSSALLRLNVGLQVASCEMAMGLGVKDTVGKFVVTRGSLRSWVRLPPSDREPQGNFCWKFTRLSMVETASTGSSVLREITDELVA